MKPILLKIDGVVRGSDGFYYKATYWISPDKITFICRESGMIVIHLQDGSTITHRQLTDKGVQLLYGDIYEIIDLDQKLNAHDKSSQSSITSQ